MKILILLFVGLLFIGCSKVSQEELNEKIKKCTAEDMDFTYMKDFRGKNYDVVCVRKHPNEK